MTKAVLPAIPMLIVHLGGEVLLDFGFSACRAVSSKKDVNE